MGSCDACGVQGEDVLTSMLSWQGLALAWPKVPEYQMAAAWFMPPCSAPACMREQASQEEASDWAV